MAEHKKAKRCSSKDVAQLAGVSQSTVSRVFSEKADLISAATRKKVMAAADQLGYKPSMIGRSLSKNSTKIIGIEMNDFTNSFYMKALGLFTEVFQKKGYSLMLFNGEAADRGEEKLQRAFDYQVDGLILTNATISDSYLKRCEQYEMPVFMFNRFVYNDQPYSAVVGDNYKGGKAVAELFAEQGFESIVYLAGDSDTSTNRLRQDGFMSVLHDRDVAVTILDGRFSYDSGFERAQKLLEVIPKPDAVFCASDSIALGFMDYIQHQTDVRIPEDLSVVGYDGIDEGANITYELTTYRQPLKAIVDATADALVAMIESGDRQKVHQIIEGEMLMRKSLRQH